MIFFWRTFRNIVSKINYSSTFVIAAFEKWLFECIPKISLTNHGTNQLALYSFSKVKQVLVKPIMSEILYLHDVWKTTGIVMCVNPLEKNIRKEKLWKKKTIVPKEHILELRPVFPACKSCNLEHQLSCHRFDNRPTSLVMLGFSIFIFFIVWYSFNIIFRCLFSNPGPSNNTLNFTFVSDILLSDSVV